MFHDAVWVVGGHDRSKWVKTRNQFTTSPFQAQHRRTKISIYRHAKSGKHKNRAAVFHDAVWVVGGHDRSKWVKTGGRAPLHLGKEGEEEDPTCAATIMTQWGSICCRQWRFVDNCVSGPLLCRDGGRWSPASHIPKTMQLYTMKVKHADVDYSLVSSDAR